MAEDVEVTPARHCVGCGRLAGPQRDAEHCDGSCRRAMDPPRFCASCGRRTAVQVTPTGWRSRCRGCGAQASASAAAPGI